MGRRASRLSGERGVRPPQFPARDGKGRPAAPSVARARSAQTPLGVASARLGSLRVNCAAVIPHANRTCHAWPPWPAGTEHRRQRPRFSSEPSDRRRLISPSIARVSGPAMARSPVAWRCSDSTSFWSAFQQLHDKCVRHRSSQRSTSSRASCAPRRQRSRGPSAAASQWLS
jgi:hypothetical protein